MTMRKLVPATLIPTSLIPTSLILALLLVPGLAGNAQADIPVPGQHGQRTEVILDFGVYADYTTRIHKVAKGDTLQSIAKAMLGRDSRWREIADLNPGVKPEKLAVATNLLIPPAKTPVAVAAETKREVRGPQAKAGPKVWWHLLSLPDVSTKVVPFAHGQKVPVYQYGASVFAVRHDKLTTFMDGINGSQSKQLEFRALRKNPPAWFAETKGLHVGRGGAKDNDPVWKIEKRMQITSIAKGVIHTKTLSVRYFGKNGKELSAKEIKRSKSRWNIILLLLAAGGAAGLFFVLRRRRAHVPAAA